MGTLQKVSWSRAGRTDKGVHAVGQVIDLWLCLLWLPTHHAYTMHIHILCMSARLSYCGCTYYGCISTYFGGTCQIIGVKLVGLDHEQLLHRINHELDGSEICVLGLEPNPGPKPYPYPSLSP
mgnify:CR=1 FL=1